MRFAVRSILLACLVAVLIISCRRDEKVRHNGKLDPGEIKGTMVDSLDIIKVCYDTELKNDPTLNGMVVVDFVISESGSVDTASINKEKTTLKSDAVGSCMISEILKISFTAPTGGKVDVSYPFQFKPLKNPPKPAGETGPETLAGPGQPAAPAAPAAPGAPAVPAVPAAPATAPAPAAPAHP